jgi:uncharacterized membrane protein YhaH (DUF805 family)
MVQSTLKRLIDPRGRVGRSEMLMLAAVLIGLEVLAAVITVQVGDNGASPVFILKLLMLLIGLTATIKRLHDIGYSGWWILGGAAILCMWTAIVAVGGLFVMGREVLMPGSTSHMTILALAMLPAIAMTLWLHVAAGEPYKNEYGNPSAPLSSSQTRPLASPAQSLDEQTDHNSGIPAV